MARPVVFNWPARDLAAICAAQTSTGAALVLNGTLQNPGGYTGAPSPTIVFPGYSKNVSISNLSIVDLSGINFTVVGTYNGAVVQEVHVGPGAGLTVSTTQVFDTITSITPSASISPNQVTVGTGTVGNTPWFLSNYHASVRGLEIQVVLNATAVTYSFQTTLDDVSTNPSPTVFTPIVAMTGATTNQLASYLDPSRYSRIAVTASNNTGLMTTTFLQQGIN